MLMNRSTLNRGPTSLGLVRRSGVCRETAPLRSRLWQSRRMLESFAQSGVSPIPFCARHELSFRFVINHQTHRSAPTDRAGGCLRPCPVRAVVLDFVESTGFPGGTRETLL